MSQPKMDLDKTKYGRLISAAPEMLELLQNARYIKGSRQSVDQYRELVATLLARIEGKGSTND